MVQELTKKQTLILEDFLKTNNKTQTARNLGMSREVVRDQIFAIERKGLAPWGVDFQIPDHMHQTKTTIQLDGQGNIIQEWKRLSPLEELARDVVEGLCEKVRGKGRVFRRKPKKHDSEDICFEMCLYDLHFGMYACREETGSDDYDTDIATKRLLNASEDLLGRARRPAVVRVVLGGDQLHADNHNNQTPRSGNVVDVDTRHGIVVRKIIAATRDVIRMASEVGDRVEVYVIQGNHDPESSIWLQEVLKAYYCECTNVTVCTQLTARKQAEWGHCLSVFGHGDSIKADKWAQIVAAEFPHQWGRTRHRYARLGHFHSKKVIAPVVVHEVCGLEVTYLSSLSAADAWHSSAGFVGTNRGMQAFELHRQAGQIGAYIHNIGMTPHPVS